MAVKHRSSGKKRSRPDLVEARLLLWVALEIIRLIGPWLRGPWF